MKPDPLHPDILSLAFRASEPPGTGAGRTWSDRLQEAFGAPPPRLMITDTDPSTAGFFRQEELRCADANRLLSGSCDTGRLCAAIGLKGVAQLTLHIRFRAVFGGPPRLWCVLERRRNRLWTAEPATDQPLAPERERLTGFDLTLPVGGFRGAADDRRLRWIAVGPATSPRGTGAVHA